MIGSRSLAVALFAAALLAFLLPFGTVSCGEPVTFTGLELATSTVHGDDEALVDDIEGQGAFFAILAAISVLAGAGLCLLFILLLLTFMVCLSASLSFEVS